ncbi:hypothetical protein SYNPS1DRAFT_27612 [Syncephalis pseudoplumigaleata]|uniref:Uncharacterized protein n=1 Tax=Syncephalis pseudoplumigaleata TaxID=1712513 RepID=A0A4P9Z2J6_9FUNG|nr:hypothetical protein SYNPS1DRAFT_27612 [Syncephalis pseudoplumigaleata]|eukprot:RKP26714.1 hypothetical protein SYNPS1DRAFT_27612 [Syncephalis pseudoplumigaleata]
MDLVDAMDMDPAESAAYQSQCKNPRSTSHTAAGMTGQQEVHCPSPAYAWMKLRAGQQHALHAMSMDTDADQECRHPTDVCQSGNTAQRFAGQPCAFCEKPYCQACLSECFACLQHFCSICSTINYDAAHERSICLSCLNA